MCRKHIPVSGPPPYSSCLGHRFPRSYLATWVSLPNSGFMGSGFNSLSQDMVPSLLSLRGTHLPSLSA